MRRLAAVIGVAAAVAATGGTAHAGPPRTPVVPSLEPAETRSSGASSSRHPRACAPPPGRLPAAARASSTRRPTGSGSRPGSPRSPRRARSTTSPSRRSRPSKTTLRNGEAAKIRALGPNFHALAEIHYAGWSQWVASNSATWFDAGVEARKRMEAAGFDVSKGDTWAVNEFSSAVRVGTGAARQNARDLVRGLATGERRRAGQGRRLDDRHRPVRAGHDALPDEPPELDGRRRLLDGHERLRQRLVAGGLPGLAARTRCPGAPVQQRRDYLNDYLQHELVLAARRRRRRSSRPGRTSRAAYSPLASAAWSWDTGYGWTAIPYDQMQSFVSTAGLRAAVLQRRERPAAGPLGLRLGAAERRASRTRTSPSQSGLILDRLAAAIRDSAARLQPGRPRDRGMHEHLRRRLSRRRPSPSSGSRSGRGRSRC